MANVAFTRDEAILTLDVILFSGKEHFNPNSESVIELSRLLNELPIHSQAYRTSNFRNPIGISDQINGFKRKLYSDKKTFNVGNIFFEIYDEYQNNIEQIHRIAESIKANKEYFDNYLFGNTIETYKFPEGALLGHLHRMVETRDGARIHKSKVCDVCHLDLCEIYKPVDEGLLEAHLTVSVTETDGKAKYRQVDFITVCPTCHALLHRYRPWVGKQNCSDILR